MSHKLPFQRNIAPRSSTETADVTGLVTSYAAWLSTSTQSNTTGSYLQYSNAYIKEALATIMVRGQEISLFAPFRRKFSALQTVTIGQAFVLCILVLALILGLMHYHTEMLIGGIAVVSVLYFVDLLFVFLLSARALSRFTAEQIDDAVVHALADADWPRYTILCPLYHEAEVVPQFVEAMQNLDYPTDKLQILLLTEEDDTETRDRIEEMNLPPHFSIVMVPAGKPRTKPRACNFGLLHATGDYVVIYDAEDIPEPLQLKKAVLTFANHGPDVVCVQAKLNFYNVHQNLLTRCFTTEYSSWFDLMLPGLQSVGLPLPLGGTSNHFWVETLRALGAWDAFNVTEDCDLGLRLAHYQLKTVMLDSTTYEEANSQFKNWLRQRSRWIKGYMQTYLVNMRQPLRYLLPRYWREFLSLQLVIGGKIAVLFVNPLMWMLVAIYILYRPTVSATYHALFPMPILYIGTICLVFGNFFYMYSHLIGCLKRRQYSLIKWTLLLPIYWAMMSIAALIALFQLIFKPHYWEKTQHGFHLHKSRSLSGSTAMTETFESVEDLPKTALKSIKYLPVSSKTKAYAILQTTPLRLSEEGEHQSHTAEMHVLSKIATIPLPASENAKRPLTTPVKRSVWKTVFADPCLVSTCAVACVASVTSLYYFFQSDQILTYRDAYSHMLIARRIFDSATPGFAQLGGVWLPLPHLLMLPFIWNDYLWHTGLAGSFTSMPCYIVASVYLFLAQRRMTKDSRSSFVGTLLFMLNPNVLYLQTTALSEMVLIATMMAACYYLLAWIQDDNPKQLILAALAICLATISRYDGWFLFLAFLGSIMIIGWMKRQRWVEIEGTLLTFGTLGGLGIVLWFIWCSVIFADPLYFQHGPFSAQADQDPLLNAHILYTYHNLWQSIRFFALAFIESGGQITFALAIFSFITFMALRRFSVEVIAGLMFGVPLVFYPISLYFGQIAILVPTAVPADAPHFLLTPYGLYNTRYGVEAIVPAAFFVATLANSLSLAVQPSLTHLWSSRQTVFTIVAIIPIGLLIIPSILLLATIGRLPLVVRRPLGQVILVLAIVAQTALTVSNGIILSQEGRYGLDCAPPNAVAIYLAQHYAGGRILEDLYTSREAGVDFKNIIYEGSGSLWTQALKAPASLVDWVVLNPTDKDDLVAEHIHLGDSTFLSQFIAVLQDPSGLFLFHRKWLSPLPTRDVPSSLLNEHSLCRVSLPRHLRLVGSLTRPDFQTGVVFPRWSLNGYSQDDTTWLKGLQEIHTQTGARWIELPILFSQATLTSTHVMTGLDAPTLTALADGIRAAHAIGYHVFVPPLLIVDGPHWSGEIHFSTYKQEQQWFDSYWHALKPYVEVAAREGAEQISIGTEYQWLEESAPSKLWDTLIARVRSTFPGTITYNMNWSTLQVPPAAWMHNANLGMIGVSTYVPLTDIPVRIDPRQIFDLWSIKVKSQLDRLSVEVGKPVLLSEIGFRNSADTFYHSWLPYSSANADPEEQAYACDAALANITHDPNIGGAFFWGWDNVGLFRLRGLQSGVVIHSWYASLDAG